MTYNQAIEIINLLKQGKSFRQGHYQNGYAYISYDKNKEIFIYKYEIFTSDIYTPDIDQEKYKENKFCQLLQENYTYENIKKHLV